MHHFNYRNTDVMILTSILKINQLQLTKFRGNFIATVLGHITQQLRLSECFDMNVFYMIFCIFHEQPTTWSDKFSFDQIVW